MTIRAATLTNEDITNIQSIAIFNNGENFDAMIDALESGDIPEGVNSEDLFAYILENVGTASIDPDSMPEGFWIDTEVKDMLQDFYNKNVANEDLELLMNDVKMYLEDKSGVSMDTLNQAINIINDYVSEYGPITSGSADTTEFENLVNLIKNINPFLYLLLSVIYNQGPRTAEDLETIFEGRQDINDELQDKIEELGELDPTDTDDQQRSQELQYTISALQQEIKVYDELAKVILESLESTIETASDGIQRIARTYSTILQNW